MTPNEEWRRIEGYEDRYEVSSLGRIRSVDRPRRNAVGQWMHKGRVLALSVHKKHMRVNLRQGGENCGHEVHPFVARAFLGPRPEGLEVCHNNGDGTDNRVENLRYDTHRANGVDAVLHGQNHYANRTHCNQGHEFTAENTLMRIEKGEERGRRCIKCKVARSAKASERRRQSRVSQAA